MEKNERIESKRIELMRSFETLQPEQLRVAQDLIGQAAFMAVELEDLAEIISKEGMTEEYTNGANQSGRKVSSNAKMYSTLIGKYNSIVAKLLQLVPEGDKRARDQKPEETDVERQAREEREKQRRLHELNLEMGRAYTAAVSRLKIPAEEQSAYYRDFCNNWRNEHRDLFEGV